MHVKELTTELREKGMPKLYDQIEVEHNEELESASRAARNSLVL